MTRVRPLGGCGMKRGMQCSGWAARMAASNIWRSNSRGAGMSRFPGYVECATRAGWMARRVSGLLHGIIGAWRRCASGAVLLGERFAPAEAGGSVAGRLVLAADPAVESGFVDELEHEGVVDLARARLVAARVVGQLNVGDAALVLLEGVGQFAFHALGVVDVVLDEQVVRADLVDDLGGLGRVVQEEA